MAGLDERRPIRDAIESAIAYLREHPEEAAYTDSPAIAVLEAGLRVRVSGSAGESVTTDMVAAVGGAGSAPSPGWLLRAAQASCVATLIRMRAEMVGLTVAVLEVSVDSESDDRGILGIDSRIPSGPISTRIVVGATLEGSTRAEVEAIVGWAVDHCPVTDATRRAVPLDVTIR
jgi:uncharacterized OsmC-like protein